MTRIALNPPYAYVPCYDSFVVVDISDPLQPVIAGEFPGGSDWVAQLEVDGNRLFVLHSNTLTFYDLTNPVLPTKLGQYSEWGIDFFVSLGQYVLVDGPQTKIIDISDPANPFVASSGEVDIFDLTDADKVGDWLVFASHYTGLQVIDVSDPVHPENLFTYYMSSPKPYRVRMINYSAIVMAGSYLKVIDLRSGNKPRQIGEVILSGEGVSLEVEGDYAYAQGWHTLDVINLSDLTNPTIVGSVEVSGSDHMVHNSFAFVVSQRDGLQAVNLSPPTHPAVVSQIAEGRAVNVEIAGDFAYVSLASELQVFDISSGQNAVEIGACTNISSYDMTVIDELLIGLTDRKLTMTDISIPTDPYILSQIDLPSSNFDLAVIGTIVYTSAWDDGIRVIDVADPENPQYLGSAGHTWYPSSVATDGVYLYVMGPHRGLQVIDVSDPMAPLELSSNTDLGDDETEMIVHGDLMATKNRNTISLIELPDPTVSAPVLISTLTLHTTTEANGTTGGRSLAIFGDRLFVGDPNNNPTIVQISDRQHPWIVKEIDLPRAERVAANSELLMTTDNRGWALHLISGCAFFADGFESGDTSHWSD